MLGYKKWSNTKSENQKYVLTQIMYWEFSVLLSMPHSFDLFKNLVHLQFFSENFKPFLFMVKLLTIYTFLVRIMTIFFVRILTIFTFLVRT